MKYFDLMTKHLSIFLALVALCCLQYNVYAQRAENLNLNKIVQPPYNCYGALADGCPNAEKLGFKVGLQCYTFTKYTFFEAIDLVRALGLHYIEPTSGTRICKGMDMRVGNMTPEWRKKVKEKLAQSGVQCKSIYWWMSGSGKGFENMVKNCKEMGWTIVTDPKREAQGGVPISYYDEILKRYGVKMVLTNHPKAAPYWNPDFTIEDVTKAGPNIGASIDVGHYMRGGFEIYDIAKRYVDAGKMYHFHMRDVSHIDPHGLDVPVGTGAARLRDVFQLLADNNVKPIMSLEYEHDFDNPMPYLIKSVNNINEICGDIIHQKKLSAQKGDTIKLEAGKALLSKGLNLKEDGAVHSWNKPNQKMEWNVNLPSGNYEVLISYSQPHKGSAMIMQADGQELASLFPNTFTWYDFSTFDMGVLKIEKGGNIKLLMKGLQPAIKRNKEGKLVADGALPDVKYVMLVPTSLPETSQPIDILKKFKGERLFDGKTFAGWEGNEGEQIMRHFRITKGAIVAGNLKDILKNNQFLRTKERYDDFELRLKYKIVANGSFNGGVQFRSEPSENPKQPYEMKGYQADIISWKAGALYDEQRRWTFLGYMQSSDLKNEKNKWHEYIIRCEGPRIRLWLDGVKTVDYIEPFTSNPLEKIGTIPQDGFLALQIHSGKPAEIWYKDITIQKLK